jgi:hypothetical protein
MNFYMFILIVLYFFGPNFYQKIKHK